MKQATYRVIRFPKLGRFVAIAWNYEQAVLVSPGDFPTYTEARMALDKQCAELGIELKWFDGEYDCAGIGECCLVPRQD